MSSLLLDDKSQEARRRPLEDVLLNSMHILYEMFPNIRYNLTSLKEKSDFPDVTWVAVSVSD